MTGPYTQVCHAVGTSGLGGLATGLVLCAALTLWFRL